MLIQKTSIYTLQELQMFSGINAFLRIQNWFAVLI